MLFKINTSIIDLDELFYIDLDTDRTDKLDFYFNNEEPFSIECDDIKQTLNELKTYKFLFYIKNSKTILNLKQVLSIVSFTDSRDNYYFRVFNKNNCNLILSLNTKDFLEINEILKEIQELS